MFTMRPVSMRWPWPVISAELVDGAARAPGYRRAHGGVSWLARACRGRLSTLMFTMSLRATTAAASPGSTFAFEVGYHAAAQAARGGGRPARAGPPGAQPAEAEPTDDEIEAELNTMLGAPAAPRRSPTSSRRPEGQDESNPPPHHHLA